MTITAGPISGNHQREERPAPPHPPPPCACRLVPALDRYGRSLKDLVNMVGELRRREIGFCSLHECLDTTTPGGRLVFHVFAALAEFIRELIVSGTREGLDAARARGRVGGRPTVATPEHPRRPRPAPQPRELDHLDRRDPRRQPGTLYNHIPGLQELRASGRVPNRLSAD
ncbi:recombinase family protein [Streptomyces sp. NPDC002004]